MAFVLGLAALFAVAIATAFLARSLPSYGLDVRSAADGPIFTAPADASRTASLQLLRITSPATGTSLAPSGADDAVRRGERLITPQAMANQDLLAAMAASGDLSFQLRGHDGRTVEWQRARRPTTLGWPFWIAASAGVAGALSALWILVLRPRDASARAIAATGLALCIAALPFAVLQNGELIVGGILWRRLVTTNWFGAQLFGSALICYFALFPRPLGTPGLRRLGLAVLALVALALVPLAQGGHLAYDDIAVLVSTDFLIIVALVVVQWRASRGDPLGRAALRLVGSATVITLALFLLVTYLTPLLGAPPEWADPLAFVLMLPPFIAIAIGVTRGWIFDLDRWAWRLIASALSLLLIVAVDVTLLVATQLAPGTATTVAIVVGGALWIVSRHSLLERLFSRSRRDGARLLSQSGEIALAVTEAERFQRWSQALEDCFRPLSITPADHVGPARLEDAGVAILVGAPPFGPSLRLYAANKGRGLFNGRDTSLVDSLLLLCEQTDAARQAYDRGMYEERERIARDLHDDVGGRLVTSLHRDSLDDTRGDVRDAIREMRQLLTGLRGGRRHVSDLVALCRVDAGDRLDAAGIRLAWPIMPAATDHHVRYSVFRAVEATLREAVTNIIRHARAQSVAVDIRVAISQGRPALFVDLKDDGCGLSANHAEGRGLFNMRRRIAEIGGSFAMRTGDGTQITLRVPLDLHSPKQGGGGVRTRW
ncbi:signal transduction histidine kinase [Polymorphobacter fuscus]|uniref:Histidine kinase/HSP90-like ATPase domain-containing protein n=1 Tax=Sandarakinorhabdus fusca TaxID=1439888 RepID=A0A7C9KGU1_9SPHN|nr:ATP-binding protein [Polymorphobacter fuscus]KAB7648800.1 hypothetical protein F9290_03800 [Polymorphobacter fuscus]MQT16380.1 hypothetical protein [Polymorphobacter fuscus]NJC07331.1 signal transduction histidine kinase [Polymorphobacter fuscus]